MQFPSRLVAVLVALAVVSCAFAADDKKEVEKKPQPNPAAKADDKKDPEKKPDNKKDADKEPGDKKDPEKKPDVKKDPEKKPDDKKDPPKKPDAKPVDKKEPEKKPPPRPAAAPKVEQPKPEKIEYGLVFAGRMASVETSQKTFSVAITQNVPEPYLNGRFIAVRIRQVTQNVDLVADDNMKIRMANPPLDFDEKGKPKKYTSKELKELKGPGNLWGFPGDFDSLKSDQIVRVYLAKTKPAPRPVARKGKDKDADAGFEDKPKVVMIEVLGEVPRR